MSSTLFGVEATRNADSQLRRGLLLRRAMEVLQRAGGDRVPSKEVLDQVADLLVLTEHERSLNKSGTPRFDTYIRFASGWAKTIGWLDKTRAGWSITPAGEAALTRYEGDDLAREARRQYLDAFGSNANFSDGGDPRWQTVAQAINALPEGGWTTYGDLSTLVGLPSRSIGTFLKAHEIPNAYRVLSANGSIAEGFAWSDPNRTDDPRAVLDAEGVEFDASGRASAAQRVTAEELRDVVGTPYAGARAWLVRGSAISGVNVVGRWLSEGFVSLAASHLRPVDPGIALDTLRAIVEADYAHLTYNQRTAKLAQLHAFLNRMSIGDTVVTTSDGRVNAGKIAGAAQFGDAGDAHTTIRRSVDWNGGGVDFADLDDALQSKLKSSATVVDLTELASTVEALLTTDGLEPPRRPMLEATLPTLPEGIVDKLLVGSEWLHEFVDLLRTRRQVILHGPPGTGKTFLALAVAEALTEPANVQLVQFHPAYSYEDFFEGYRPAGIDEEGRLGFTLRPGPFRKIVDQAAENPSTPFVLIVDEINRANLAKVFGELYFLLEYRDRQIELMYGSGDQGRDFSLPKNVYIVGTMNTADRSIALVDAAMRRRFAFLSLHPDDPHLRGVLRLWLEREELPTGAADLLDALNARISDRDSKIGPSYLMRAEAGTDHGLDRIWRTSVLPLLEELHYGDQSIDVTHRYGLAGLRSTVNASRTLAADETSSNDA